MLESLRSVEHFLDENADKLASVVNTGARQRLTAAIADLSTHASEQTGSNLAAQGATQKKEALRLALLRDHMAPIARIAAADIPNLPELPPFACRAGNRRPRSSRATRTVWAPRPRLSPTRSPRPDSPPTSSRS